MNKNLFFFFFALVLLPSSSIAVKESNFPIKHVVVLMLENRAFDHMCGYLKQLNPEIEGLNGDETNPYDPSDASSPTVQVNDQAPYVDPNPGHSIPDTTIEIFGSINEIDVEVPPMNGFVKDAEEIEKGWGPKIMSCFNSKSVPVISTLATEFGLFDRWFSSVPGPTEVNRMYVHSGTSYGAGDNNIEKLIAGFPQKTIYDSLTESNVTWNIYMEEVSTTLFFTNMRSPAYWDRFKQIEDFYYHVREGILPSYSFLEPRYFSILDLPANDQHPSHDVSQGELFMKSIYEALRNSDIWNETLLMITYDEHGGFYDHFPTPLKNVPNPDGRVSADPAFNFTRLGVRVPTLLVSPWINKGLVIHEPNGPTPDSHFDHTSVLATLKKVFGLNDFLTKRDAWAGTFDEFLTQRTSPRTDCPTELPSPPINKKRDLVSKENSQPMNDLQRGFMGLASAVNGGHDMYDNLVTEEEGSKFVREEMKRFFKKN